MTEGTETGWRDDPVSGIGQSACSRESLIESAPGAMHDQHRSAVSERGELDLPES